MELVGSLTSLRSALTEASFPLALPDRAGAQQAIRQIVTQLDDYVLPRLVNLEAPLLAVVGGSTGAGKSTLVNSLIGRVVSQPGVIRPTTRSPVLVHNPDDARWFDNDRVLPGLIRSRASSQDQRSLQLVAEPTLPAGLAIL
ncbi:MAG: ABC transporter, partial [Propionibacterium sp.]|nr:ABC transporter [Propionibacterium sp.]